MKQAPTQPQSGGHFRSDKNLLVAMVPSLYNGNLVNREVCYRYPNIINTVKGRAWRCSTATPGIDEIVLSPTPAAISAGQDVTMLAAFSNINTVEGNPGLWRDGQTFLVYQGATLRPWIRWDGNEILKPSSGPSLVSGKSYYIAYRIKSSAYADVWWEGNRQHYATHSVATPSLTVQYIGFQYSSSEWFGDISGFFAWNRALSDDEMAMYTLNPWLILQSNTRLPYVKVATASLSRPNICVIT